MVLFAYVEGSEGPLVLKLQGGFRSAVLNKAEDLKIELRIPNNTPVAADVFISDVGAADITFVLDFDELGVHNSPKYLQNMTDNLIRRNSLDQRYHVVGLEITYLFLNLANHFEVIDRKLQLRVDIDLIANLSQCVAHHKHISSLQSGFQVDLAAVFHEQGHPRFVLSRLEVDMTSALHYLVVFLAASAVLVLKQTLDRYGKLT